MKMNLVFILLAILGSPLIGSAGTEVEIDHSCPTKHFLVGKSEGTETLWNIQRNFHSEEVDGWEKLIKKTGCFYLITEDVSFREATVHKMTLVKKKKSSEKWVKSVLDNLSSVFDTRYGVKDTKNIPEVCKVNIGSMNAINRIQKCYLEGYSTFPRDKYNLREAVKRGLSIIEGDYAKMAIEEMMAVPEVSEMAIKVIESLKIGRKDTNIAFALKALGYKRSLFATNYWKKTRRPDLFAQKIVSAALLLHSKDMLFIDTNYHEENDGPAVIKKSDYVEGQSTYLMGYSLENDLTRSMEKVGFQFSMVWQKEDAVPVKAQESKE